MSDYKLVPVEPTPEMVEAGKYAMEADCYASGIYADMLAVAPDHIPDTGKMVSLPKIREIFLRNGARIEPGRDDLPDWVYESVFELLDSAIQYAAPDAQGEPDVAGLVEALNKVMHCRYFVLLSSAVQHEVSATLAAHRKGGGDENHKQ